LRFFPEDRSSSFPSVSLPRNSARALARALFRLSFSRVKESKSARGSKKTKRGERREPFSLDLPFATKKISKFKVSKKWHWQKTTNTKLSSLFLLLFAKNNKQVVKKVADPSTTMPSVSV
jgi:hypothetical protein